MHGASSFIDQCFIFVISLNNLTLLLYSCIIYLMTERPSQPSLETLLNTRYTRVNEAQTKHIAAAMEMPENQANFEVFFLTIDTPEGKMAAATEWSEHAYGMRQIKAQNAGSLFAINSRDSVERLLSLLDDEDEEHFVTHALLKIVIKNPDANYIDLLRTYYQ